MRDSCVMGSGTDHSTDIIHRGECCCGGRWSCLLFCFVPAPLQFINFPWLVPGGVLLSRTTSKTTIHRKPHTILSQALQHQRVPDYSGMAAPRVPDYSGMAALLAFVESTTARNRGETGLSLSPSPEILPQHVKKVHGFVSSAEYTGSTFTPQAYEPAQSPKHSRNTA